MWNKRVVLLLGACLLATARAADPVPTAVEPTFKHPDRIRYDAHCFYLEGQPTFLYSGAMQYFRVPPELWKSRLERMKEAGLNCVETYLCWSYHEREEPSSPGDFSKLQHMEEINSFIQLARDMGFYVIIRPGPYICAEWDRGGLPEWLLKYKPPGHEGPFLRTSDPAVQQWQKHWIEAAAKVVRPHQLHNLPKGSKGVIAWQLENEFEISNVPTDDQVRVLNLLADDSQAAGMEVPFFTCRSKVVQTAPALRKRMFDTVTAYPNFNMAPLVARINATAQAGAPRVIVEAQGGWFAQVGGKLSEEMGHNAAQLTQIGLTCAEQGCTLINFYTFHGGSQFGYGAAQNLIQSYDYNAPLREWGGVGDRYAAAKALGQFFNEQGARLATAEAVPIDLETDYPDVQITARLAQDGTRFLFIRSSNKEQPRKGGVRVRSIGNAPINLNFRYDLPPFGAKVLVLPHDQSPITEANWYPKAVSLPARPEKLAVASLDAMPQVEAYEQFVNWRPATMGQGFAQLGINDTRYVAFRSGFDLTEEQVRNPPALLAQITSGALLLSINGRIVAPAESQAGVISLKDRVRAGRNTVEVLFENNGYIHHTAALEADKTVATLALIPAGAAATLSEWRMKTVPARLPQGQTVRPEVAAEVTDAAWQVTSVTSGPNIGTENTTAVFRASLTVSAEQLKKGIQLALGQIDDTGEIYLNGRRVATTDRGQSFNRDITASLHEGKNAIAVVVNNQDQVGGLFQGAYVVAKGTPLASIEVASEAEGMQKQYGNLDTDTRGWIKFMPDTPAGGVHDDLNPDPLMTWYRAEFRMPKVPAGTWVPFHLHLEANVNGEVFLNGHHLGAYWAAGPQRDIYLPECWLNVEGPNVWSIQARPTTWKDGTSPFLSAVIRPYAEYAEKR